MNHSRTSTIGAAPTAAWLFLLLYLGAFIGAELLAVGGNPILGLFVHALLLTALLVQGVLSKGKTADLYVALSVIPLIRLLSLSMPVWLTERTGWFALINAPLIIATVVALYTLGYRWRDVGIRWGDPVTQGLIALSGVAIGFLERLIIQPEPLANSLTFSAILWPIISLMLFTGLSEELLFRGVLQKASIDALGIWPGILFISAIFGVMHIGWNSALDVAFVTAVGAYFGWAVYKTRSILGVTIAHGLANIMLFIYLPLTT